MPQAMIKLHQFIHIYAQCNIQYVAIIGTYNMHGLESFIYVVLIAIIIVCSYVDATQTKW